METAQKLLIRTLHVLSGILPFLSGLAPFSPAEPDGAIGISSVCQCWDVCHPRRQRSVQETYKQVSKYLSKNQGAATTS